MRVPELRELLQKASVSIPAKSNKSDLIAKVLASPAALQTLESQNSSAPAAKPKGPESSQGGQDDDLVGLLKPISTVRLVGTHAICGNKLAPPEE